MQDKDVNAKFLTTAETVLGKSRASQALARLRDLENLSDLFGSLGSEKGFVALGSRRSQH